ncbi:MAG: beta-lactamase family protein [Chloroflexi bacterium]|nr:beta-lactamase family protein [Chloroflexota bacterium]
MMRDRSEKKFDDLSQFVEENMTKWDVPGLALGVFYQGETVTAGFGMTNVNHPLPVTDETLFQIGSVTKTFVGTAVMRLVEMGKLELDATVQTYLPQFKVADKTASTQATLRHLLTHTSGWVGDDFHDTGAGDDALAKYVADMAALEQLAPVGTVYSYNNAGFSVLGRIIEKITGKTFETALQELVLQPLGLANSYLTPTDVMTHRFVVGHRTADNRPQVALPWPIERSGNPQGGIACHIKDLLQYARFHLGNGISADGTRLLTADSLTQMQSPQTTIWENEHWGLSWGVKQVAGERQISHGGGTNGQICSLTFFPNHNFAIAVLTNADEGGKATAAITTLALKQYLGLELPEPEPIAATEEELAAFVGHYGRPFMDVELGMLSGKLIGMITPKQGFPNEDAPPLPAPPPLTLALCEKDRLLVLDGAYKGAKAEIVRRVDGSVGWLRIGGRIHQK